MPPEDRLIALTAKIIGCYVANNATPAGDLPIVIKTVHAALSGVGSPPAITPAAAPRLTAAQIRGSITPDALFSFIDGRPYRTLKRHLATQGMTVAQYRTRFGLPSDYPAVAPAYSQARSVLAKAVGLGRKGNSTPAPVVSPLAELELAPKAPRRRFGFLMTK